VTPRYVGRYPGGRVRTPTAGHGGLPGGGRGVPAARPGRAGARVRGSRPPDDGPDHGWVLRRSRPRAGPQRVRAVAGTAVGTWSRPARPAHRAGTRLEPAGRADHARRRRSGGARRGGGGGTAPPRQRGRPGGPL
ncbi:MAG: hypothetical protein AVDCRST_MAG32-375, partial [uncultured Nocardioides sp.]